LPPRPLAWQERPFLAAEPHSSSAAAFVVTDTASLADMTLSLSYRGGVVVYVNGKEVVRGHLPASEIKADTPAEDYPLRLPSPTTPCTRGISWGYGDPEKFKDRLASASADWTGEDFRPVS